jgi:hypothetical protein
MKNWILRFSDQFNARMKLENDKTKVPQSMSISMGSDRPQFSDKHYQNTGLKILINDTEYTQVSFENYDYDSASKVYTVDFFIDIEDHFGLDYHDALTYQASALGLASGFARWWVLQHQRDFKPFKQKIYVKATVRGQL